MIASNFSTTGGRSDEGNEADEESDQEAAADGHHVFDERARPVFAVVGVIKTLPDCGTTHGAEHGPDDARTGSGEGMEERAADDGTGERAHQETSCELWCGLAARSLGELVGDELDEQKNRQDRD